MNPLIKIIEKDKETNEKRFSDRINRIKDINIISLTNDIFNAHLSSLIALLEGVVKGMEGRKKLKLRGRKPKEMDNAWIEDTKDGGYNQALSDLHQLLSETIKSLEVNKK